MEFGEVPVDAAGGAILAHSEMLPGGRLRKGQVLGAGEIAALRDAGYARVTVARLGPGDVAEDAAATRLAKALHVEGSGLVASAAFTGRVNLNATGPGIVALDAAAVHRLNLTDPAITLATLAPFQRVAAGTLVGTVKIITYGVGEGALGQACAVAAAVGLRVLPVTRKSAGLVLTDVAGQEAKLNLKGRRAVETRLRALGITLAAVETVAHDEAAIAAALSRLPGELLLILTGSATSDPMDTAPAALRRAGGRVMRFGMPVDPGNLLFLGDLGDRPVIGLPGCARSPALNGADWVLERLACGLAVTDADIAGMGVGGLLKEIPQRPQLREPAAKP
ncbi:molybdopterin-binding protein [Paragemmobacter straminiformis]|uniref:Molybdopterin-binding protein n=1 Tax=Paragemmobacter straminiformis TaxID=2045119 RepID=A0A842I562_9RHOB|nr:molybdopterin-binding protein [Gemmobacter straminiformis]MBC2835272.1 molybdopterin-binding protein [Gemmobacter straminiformis]